MFYAVVWTASESRAGKKRRERTLAASLYCFMQFYIYSKTFASSGRKDVFNFHFSTENCGFSAFFPWFLPTTYVKNVRG
jgi:hypothetical protein